MFYNEQDQLLKRIEANPKILVGKPIIRGMRISVQQVLNQLAAGNSTEEILRHHPMLEPEDITACILYAVKLVEEQRVYKVAS